MFEKESAGRAGQKPGSRNDGDRAHAECSANPGAHPSHEDTENTKFFAGLTLEIFVIFEPSWLAQAGLKNRERLYTLSAAIPA